MKNHNGILGIYRCLRLLLILFGMHFGNYESSAQYITSKNADEILLDLHKLNQLGSVLYIAAHPDDENTKLLAYLSKEKHYRTGYLSLTRGDGGQNLIGEEQGVELGLIRTQELLAARKIDGAQQFFTSAFDFGYSKNPTEALKIWDHDKILGDMVWIIRNFRPDIIICRFPSTGEGGHGHHTASAMLAEEAYQAAADPTKYPDQLKLGATIWQAKRLLWNTFNFGSINTQREDQFKIDIGGYNPLLGKSYGEMAALSRSQHKSQGFGVPAQRGSAIEYFATIKGESPQKDFLDGVSSDWTALGNAQINKSIDFIIDAFNPSKPNLSVPLLLKLYKEIEKCNVPIFQKKIKLDEIKELVFQCGAVYFESVTNSKYVVSNDSVSVDVEFINRLGLPIDSVAFYWNGEVVACFDSVSTNKYNKHTLRLFISNDPTSSQPYWIRDKMGNGSFTIRNIQDLLKPENDPPIQFQMKVYLHQRPFFECTSPLLYKYTDPVIGEKYEPICIVPTITLHPKKSLNIQTSNQVPVTPIELIAYKDTSMTAIYCNGKMLDIDKPYLIKRQNKRILDLYLDSGLSIFHTEKNNSLYEIHQIQYSHIAPIYYFKECTIINKVISVKTEGKKIGYFNGAGD